MSILKKIVLGIIALFALAVVVLVIFVNLKVNFLFNLDKVYLYQTPDQKIEIYKSNIYLKPDLSKSNLIKTIKLKPLTFVFGNNKDNYIDARGISSSMLYIFGLDGDDVLIGGASDDLIRGGGGTDLMIGCLGGDDLATGDDYEVLIGDDLSEDDYRDFEPIKNGCDLNNLSKTLINQSELGSMSKNKPWYFNIALDLNRVLSITDNKGIRREIKYNSMDEALALAMKGDSDAMLYVATFYKKKKAPEETKEQDIMIQDKEKLAKAGDTEAMYYMAGHHYHKTKDYNQFLYWSKQGISKNHAMSKYFLATVLLKEKDNKDDGCKLAQELLDKKYDPSISAVYEEMNIENQVISLKSRYCN